MAQAVETIEIAHPPPVVWATLADFGRLAEWAPNVDHSCLTTTAAEGVGSVRRVQVGRNALLEQVVAWEPGSELSYRVEGLPPVLRSVTNTWRIESAANGSMVSVTSDVDAGPRPPQQVVARIAGRRMAQASREMLAGLAAHLDGDHS